MLVDLEMNLAELLGSIAPGKTVETIQILPVEIPARVRRPGDRHGLALTVIVQRLKILDAVDPVRRGDTQTAHTGIGRFGMNHPAITEDPLTARSSRRSTLGFTEDLVRGFTFRESHICR